MERKKYETIDIFKYILDHQTDQRKKGFGTPTIIIFNEGAKPFIPKKVPDWAKYNEILFSSRVSPNSMVLLDPKDSENMLVTAGINFPWAGIDGT